MRWSRSLTDIPENTARSGYKARAISYFEANPTFTTDAFVEHVVGIYVDGDDEEMGQDQIDYLNGLREQHKQSLRDHLADVGIAGQVFESRPRSIAEKSKKNKIKTFSGLTVEYSGERKDHNLCVKKEGDEYVITIKTTQYDENL